MSFTVMVRMKRVGRQMKDALSAVPVELSQKPETVNDLLIALTRHSVEAYNNRREDGRMLPYLTQAMIADQAVAGKVSFGTHQGNETDPEKAVLNAIQCFEDGIYRVFYGEEELTQLTRTISWSGDNDETLFTLIRLTMLSGW